MSKIKTIGILTSGGDAPGMNAAIRAVTRSGICNGLSVKGIYRGYDGLIKDEVKSFTTEDVSGIITRGGTILKTARSKEFMTPEGMQKAYETCIKEEIDALVVIGGNGSLTGARNFAMEYDFPVVGLPGTIDNDLYGTDSTIGYDTTMNTIMSVSIAFAILPTPTNASSSSKSWVVTLVSLLKTQPLPVVQRQPSFLRNLPMSISSHVSWSAASESLRNHVSSSFPRVPNAVRSTMQTV